MIYCDSEKSIPACGNRIKQLLTEIMYMSFDRLAIELSKKYEGDISYSYLIQIWL